MDGLAQIEISPETIDIGDLDDSLGFLSRIAQLTIFEQFFEQLGSLGFRPGEFSTLLVIARNPGIRQGLLAEALHIKPAQMSKLIRGFEQRGLVRRSIPDHNRRSVELTLTEAGRELIVQSRPAFLSHETQKPERLTARETEQLKRLLRKLVGLQREGEK